PRNPELGTRMIGRHPVSDEPYSQAIRDHLEHPRNSGPMEQPDAVGVGSNPICGDTLKLMLRIRDGQVVDAHWQTVGCPPALAAGSIATELIKGRPIADAASLSREDLLAALGGLPPSKQHVAALTADALHKAVAGYQAKGGV
ncbi:MAG: iron-sulfur cluster assembly scaffold protein, partial [Dehalococcoidia bacterium]